MKRIILSVLTIVIVASSALAQTKNVNKAKRLLDNGDVAGAIPVIQEALVHEKSAEKGKTWFTYLEILSAVALSEEGDLKELLPDYNAEARKAIDKVKEYEKKNSPLYGLTELKKQEFYSVQFNMGVSKFQENDYASAIEAFSKSIIFNPEDTTANLYAGMSAQLNKDYSQALMFYYRLMELDYHDKEIYDAVIGIERAHNKDNEKALEVVRFAMKNMPNEKDFAKTEIQILIDLDLIDDATEKLVAEIDNDPENANLYYSLGFLNEQLGNTEEKIIAYGKAIELNPDHLEANFNLGVHYFNKAAEILKNADAIKDNKKYNQEVEKSNVQFRNALSYFEKAYEIRPEEIAIISTLGTIYTRLKMNDKAIEMMDKMDELEGQN